LQKQDSYQQEQKELKYYKSIYDCPIWNYHRVLNTGDTRYLYILTDYEKLPKKHLNNVFDDIFWQYQEEAGLDDNLKSIIEYKAKIAELEYEEIEKGIGNKAKISYYQRMIDGYKSKQNDSLSKRLAILSKYMGQMISPKTTLFEYIGIEKLYTDYAKVTAKTK
jgi:hypothetical protein